MSILCFKCKNNANIKINVLKYCNVCFMHFFESKLQKSIPKLHPNKSIFIYLKDTPLSNILLNFIYKNFNNRPIGKIEVFFENKKIINLFNKVDCDECSTHLNATFFTESAYKSNESIDFSNITIDSKLIQYCLNNNFDHLFYTESLNDNLLNSLNFLCLGKPVEAIENALEHQFDNLKLTNFFNDMKKKELMYYAYLKKIAGVYKAKTVNKINLILNEFLTEIDEKNSLTLFNIQNTLRKLLGNDKMRK